jgi:hypothetical protein
VQRDSDPVTAIRHRDSLCFDCSPAIYFWFDAQIGPYTRTHLPESRSRGSDEAQYSEPRAFEACSQMLLCSWHAAENSCWPCNEIRVNQPHRQLRGKEETANLEEEEKRRRASKAMMTAVMYDAIDSGDTHCRHTGRHCDIQYPDFSTARSELPGRARVLVVARAGDVRHRSTVDRRL